MDTNAFEMLQEQGTCKMIPLLEGGVCQLDQTNCASSPGKHTDSWEHPYSFSTPALLGLSNTTKLFFSFYGMLNIVMRYPILSGFMDSDFELKTVELDFP